MHAEQTVGIGPYAPRQPVRRARQVLKLRQRILIGILGVDRLTGLEVIAPAQLANAEQRMLNKLRRSLTEDVTPLLPIGNSGDQAVGAVPGHQGDGGGGRCHWHRMHQLSAGGKPGTLQPDIYFGKGCMLECARGE